MDTTDSCTTQPWIPGPTSPLHKLQPPKVKSVYVSVLMKDKDKGDIYFSSIIAQTDKLCTE